MRKFVLAVVLVLMASGAQAASYQQNGGTIVDPIQNKFGGNHSYSGANLQPGAFLANAILTSANLANANLTNANLINANLTASNLFNANLSGADLTNAVFDAASLFGADLSGADLSGANFNVASLLGADLSNAILANAVNLSRTFGNGNTLYNANTDFTGTFFNPVVAGWTLVAVPEPNTALLLSLGLTGLAARRRASRCGVGRVL